MTRAVNDAIAFMDRRKCLGPRGDRRPHRRARCARRARPFLDDIDGQFCAEARAVLDALPPEVDRVILDALGDALDAGVPVEVRWEEAERDGDISVRSLDATTTEVM